MEWQLYWPNWYKLWPSYSKSVSVYYPDNGEPCVWVNYFCIGILQIRWYS